MSRHAEVVSNATLANFYSNVVLAVPRALQRAGEFTFSLPDQIDTFWAMARHPGSIIADPTIKSGLLNASMTLSGSALPQATTAPLPAVAEGWLSFFARRLGIEHMNSLDGVFGYFASRWAVATFLIAIILNRARVYSSSRRRLRLPWFARLILRFIPIWLFLSQLRTVLQTMRCQTGFMLPVDESSDGTKPLNAAFSHEGDFMYWLSSTLLFWQAEGDSCTAAGMITSSNHIPLGSSSILWPMFLRLCLSHLVETMSCALEGRTPVPETAMTLFEHSLAFAEAEAVVRSSVGLGLFLPLKTSKYAEQHNEHFKHLTRSMVLQRLNVPPEVLLIAFISTCSHLSNHMLGVLGLQNRCRLVNTSIWGLSFMGAFIWSFGKFASAMNDSEVGVLRYPTVCIIGFVPHLLILFSVIVCGLVYAIALLVTVLSPPTEENLHTSWRERLRIANDNLQASSALSPLQIKMSDEFYTTLLKIGFNLLTAASEAVYFNEGIGVAISRSTWLEQKRLGEVKQNYLSKFEIRQQTQVPPELSTGQGVAAGLNLVDDSSTSLSGNKVTSGYARQKTAAKASQQVGQAATREEGVGGSQRSGRWYMSWLLMRGDAMLLARLMAKGIISTSRVLFLGRLTQRLVPFANPVEHQISELKRQHTVHLPQTQDFWILSDDGTSHLPNGTSVDVEYETRKRFSALGPQQTSSSMMDDYLYRWWKDGGFWGELDSSGAYEPDLLDTSDTTSLISESDASDVFDVLRSPSEASDGALSSGQTTPTQSRPLITSREQTPDLLSNLATLLDPTTPDERSEARLLASRLGRRGPTTRSQYALERHRSNLRLLSGRGDLLNDNKPLTPEEEEDILERIVLSRRRETSQSTGPSGASWSEGAEGMGSDGPQCVVCHSSPRTILLWPCRCLCLCEDCRVTMAMNNFGTCVTCRRDVVAFSRLFVP